MRASWTGAINFGLVAIPVRLFRAVEEHHVRFRYLHRECETPLVTQRYCPVHERVIPWEEVVRGYEVAPDQFIIVESEELEEMGAARNQRIDIQAFVDRDEIGPLFFDRGYYAEALPEGRPAYALLQQALQQTARVAVGRVALRRRERLAAVRPADGALAVQTLYYADEIHPAQRFALPEEAVGPRELRTAIRLVESLAEPFDARRFADEYHRRLLTLIDEKAHIAAPVPAVEGQPPEGADLLGALQASLDAVAETRQRVP